MAAEVPSTNDGFNWNTCAVHNCHWTQAEELHLSELFCISTVPQVIQHMLSSTGQKRGKSFMKDATEGKSKARSSHGMPTHLQSPWFKSRKSKSIRSQHLHCTITLPVESLNSSQNPSQAGSSSDWIPAPETAPMHTFSSVAPQLIYAVSTCGFLETSPPHFT